jgi:integrase
MAKLRQKVDGRFCVRVSGKDVYLGKDRAEAERQYHLLMAGAISATGEQPSLTVADCILRYVEHLEKFDTLSDRQRAALRYLNRGFGHYKPEQIGMAEITRLRETILTDGTHVRQEVNRAMRELARFWRWCAAHELAPAEVHARFGVLEPLKAGRCNAPESKGVSVVPLEHVRAVQAIVVNTVRAMIELQLLTGARPGEIVGLKVEDLDRTVDPWKAELTEHKTAHRGKKRVLFFGEQAQALLKPFILQAGTGCLFTHPRGVYSVSSYRQVITRACSEERANVPHWHPHQLRHTAATELRKQYGVEVARAVLGHAHVAATEIYAEVDQQVAAKVAKERG